MNKRNSYIEWNCRNTVHSDAKKTNDFKRLFVGLTSKLHIVSNFPISIGCLINALIFSKKAFFLCKYGLNRGFNK